MRKIGEGQRGHKEIEEELYDDGGITIKKEHGIYQLLMKRRRVAAVIHHVLFYRLNCIRHLSE